MMQESMGKISMNTGKTADSDKLVMKDMNEQFLMKTMDIKNQANDLVRKN